MICNFTGSPCRFTDCRLWSEKQQDCRFALAVNKFLGDSELAIHLTRKEQEILDLLARGCSNLEISTDLSITIQTAKNHVSTVMRKLGAKSRVEAVVVGLKGGMVSLN